MKLNTQYRLSMAHGFTLIEILVALMILAVIGAITMIGLQSSIRVQKTVNNRSEQLAQIQSAVIIMERDIAQIINRPIIDVDNRVLPAINIVYTSGRINFEFTRTGLINPFALQNRTTMLRVSYSWDGKSLLRTTWPVLDRIPGTQAETQVILQHITAFNIRFMNNNLQLQAPADTPALPSNNTTQLQAPLPMAIEFSLDIEGAGQISRLIPIAGWPT